MFKYTDVTTSCLAGCSKYSTSVKLIILPKKKKKKALTIDTADLFKLKEKDYVVQK